MFRKFLALIAIFTLFPISFSSAATSIKPLVSIKLFPEDLDIAGITIANNAIYQYGNTPTGAYISALNKDGSQKWLHPITDQRALLVSTGASDTAGNFWLAGVMAPPIAITAPAPSVSGSPAALNPDGVVIGSEGAMRPNLTNITLWKISSTGEGSGRYELPLTDPTLPIDISINKSGISLIAWQKAGPIFLNIDLTGNFGKVLKVGKANTSLDKVIRNSDGSSFVTGSSTELFLATRAIGARDGLINKIDSTLKITQSVRSGEKGATRNWGSGTSSLLLGGYLKSTTSSLATITKFANTLKPTWTMRAKATSGAIVVNATAGGFFAAYENSGKGTLLNLDKSGKVLATYSFPGKPVAISYQKELGLILYTGTNLLTLPSINP